MAPRDPRKTARNKIIQQYKDELRALLPFVLKETGIGSEASLNAIIGSKTDEFIDLKNEVIPSPEAYIILWRDGFKQHLSKNSKFRTSYDDLFDSIKASPSYQKYLNIFLRRSYLKHYEELYKKRPTTEEAEIWIGENHADYGLLVTPRYANGTWENDRSEIRHFKPRYWSIGHVVTTGLVVSGTNTVMPFATVDDYLRFFEHVLVRGTASPHQKAIAKLYVDFVKNTVNPMDVPLLIPEYRYEGRAAKHKYRLDFTIIDPDTMDKIGFELSPWSTHGQLKNIKKKTQKAVNEEASENFEKEMKKHKAFFKKHGIFSLIYTDSDLKDIQSVFTDMKAYLGTEGKVKQLSLHFLEDFFN